MTEPVATLEGTRGEPVIRLDFDYDQRVPDDHARAPISVREWIKSAPGRIWDAERSTWLLTATGGKNPETLLRRAGFRVRLGDDIDVYDLSELIPPLVRIWPARPGTAVVRPRFTGYETTAALLPSGSWNRDRRWFEVPLRDLPTTGDGMLSPDLDVFGDPDELAEAIAMARARDPRPEDVSTRAAAASAAFATGIDMSQSATDLISELAQTVGDIPDDFGLDLRPYQRIGALAMNAGRNFLADPPGVGKTRSALAAAAVADAERTLIVSPAVAITHWAHEADLSNLARTGEVVTVMAGRKQPALPGSGVVVVSSGLLVSRPDLVDELIEWNPDVAVIDESHHYRTWKAKRSVAVRQLTASIDGTAFALTGTPMFSDPAELASQLEITGHLGPVFGGYDAFIQTYCVTDNFGNTGPRKRKLPELKRLLNEHVWVRRNKAEIQPDLPPKSRNTAYVDVDLSGHRRAHRDALDTITEWLDEYVETHGLLPDEGVLDEYAQSRIGLISPLRKAAGLAKVPAAIDVMVEHIAAQHDVADDGGLVDDPLIVWAHHGEVIDALVEAAGKIPASARTGRIEAITGADSAERRGELAADYQAGKIAVLICSITAAGVGITLTRGCRAVFVETTWDAPEVTQAEDRQSRFGQSRPVSCDFLLASGTLDGRIHSVLAAKSETLDAVVPHTDTVALSGVNSEDLRLSPSMIVRELVDMAVARHPAAAASGRARPVSTSSAVVRNPRTGQVSARRKKAA